MKLATARTVVRYVAKRIRDKTPLGLRRELVRHFAEKLDVRVAFPDSGVVGRGADFRE